MPRPGTERPRPFDDEEIAAALRQARCEAMTVKIWAIDCETYLTVPGNPAPSLVCGSWADSDSSHIGDPAQTIQFFRDTLTRGDHLVGINLAFDIVVLANHDPSLLPLIFEAGERGQFHDCSIREALNDIAKGELADKSDDELDWNRYGMALLMLRHFNVDISPEKQGDVWRFKYAQLDGVSISSWPQAAVDYPKADARRTYDICIRQRSYRNKHDEAAQVRASIAIQLMVCWGLRTDSTYLAFLEAQVDKAWNEARHELAKANIFQQVKGEWKRNNKVLQALVSQAYGDSPPITPASKRFPSGQIAVDRDTLEESGDPTLILLATTGKNDKRKTTYLPALRRGVDVPITPNFNVLVATGRLSSDWQQMPQKGGIREAVVSRGYLRLLRPELSDLPDTVISSCDYEGLELRTMAQRAIYEVGFSKMADFINAGKDAHSYVAGFFLGVSLEEFLPHAKGKWEAYRKVAKMFNFGAGGGSGGLTIAYNAKVKENLRLCLSLQRATKCGVQKIEGFVQGKKRRVCALCVRIAKELRELWLKAWPEQGMLFEKAQRLTSNRRKAEAVVFGSNRVRGDCGYTQWLNTPFQGAGGDMTKRAMWRIQREAFTDRSSPLWGSRLFLNVHDELLTEHPESVAHEAAHRVAEIMIEEADAVTPGAKNNVEPALQRRLFKSATKVLDKRGRLRPWWPPDGKQVWDWEPDQEQMRLDMAA